ncbi:hypothetical protein EDB86DRAFT_2894148 [Lactarius hatsudake]|nr:hypothetical protein EDB86DRAFT_2894148 [Lactarius hatsudake]
MRSIVFLLLWTGIQQRLCSADSRRFHCVPFRCLARLMTLRNTKRYVLSWWRRGISREMQVRGVRNNRQGRRQKEPLVGLHYGHGRVASPLKAGERSYANTECRIPDRCVSKEPRHHCEQSGDKRGSYKRKSPRTSNTRKGGGHVHLQGGQTDDAHGLPRVSSAKVVRR